MPVKRLKEEIISISDKIKQYRSVFAENSSDLLNETVSRIVCNKFGVSDGVILPRLRNEKIKL